MNHERLHTKLRSLLTFSLLLTMISICFSTTSANETITPPEITKDMKCGNCNMKPAMYPAWQTTIIYEGNNSVAFDGSKCMFKYAFRPQEKDKKIKTILVKDFLSGNWINGMKAHYVIGSKQMGPMGKELIPFAELHEAEIFSKEHGGTIAPYTAISKNTLKPLMGHMKQMKKM